MTAISRECPPVPKTGPAATDTGTSAGSRPLPVLRAERAALPALGHSAAPPPSDDGIRKLPLTRPLLSRLVAGSFLAALLVFITGATIGISLGLHMYRDMAVAEPALTMALPPSVDVPPPAEPLPAPIVSPAPPPPAPPPAIPEPEVAPPGEAVAQTAQTDPPPQVLAEPEAPTVPEAEPAAPAVPVAEQSFVIQAAMFTRAANAEQMVRDLQTKSLPAYSRIRQNNRQQDRFFVYAGPFPTRDGAQAAIAELKKSGITDPLRVRQATETDLP